MLAFACALSQALVVRPLLRRQPNGRQQRILAQQADERTEAEWREMLSPEAYDVLRNAGTERPWSSPLNDLKEPGVLVCTGCGSPLFRVDEKFDSGSGWPSFWAPAGDDAVETKADFKLVVPRTEVLCKTCGGHLGHRFSDGPMPTGQRCAPLTARPPASGCVPCLTGACGEHAQTASTGCA